MTTAHEDELPALRQLEKAGQQDKRRSRRHLEARLEVSGQHFPCVTHIHT